MSTQPCMEEALLESLKKQAHQAQADGPAKPVPEHTYTHFCNFCIQETIWHGMGNISEC